MICQLIRINQNLDATNLEKRGVRKLYYCVNKLHDSHISERPVRADAVVFEVGRGYTGNLFKLVG